MTSWTITLSDGRTTQIPADEITTRSDGSLWLLRSVAPPPDKLGLGPTQGDRRRPAGMRAENE